MMVPTGSPASARVRLPGTRPFTTCTWRTWRADLSKSRTVNSRIEFVQPLRLHLGHRDLWDEGGALRGLRVRGVEAVLILHVDHRLAAELLSDEKASDVGAVGRDDAGRSRTHPKSVGRHAAEDDCVHLREIQRDRREPGTVDCGDAVLREELPQHRGVLIGNRGTELRKHACWQTEPSRDRVKMPGPGACAGPDQQLVDVANGDNLVHERVDGRTARSMTLCPPILITVASGRIRKSAAASAAAWSCASVSDRCMRSDSSSTVGFAMKGTPFRFVVSMVLDQAIDNEGTPAPWWVNGRKGSIRVECGPHASAAHVRCSPRKRQLAANMRHVLPAALPRDR